jgi:hypothetical protein
MVDLVKKFVKKVFKVKMEPVQPVLKTRAQIIEEGKGAYLPKRQ